MMGRQTNAGAIGEVFDRRELITKFLKCEHVVLTRFEESFASRANSYFPPDCDIELRIGESCVAEIDFTRVGSAPEVATVTISQASCNLVFEAGRDSVESVVNRTVAEAQRRGCFDVLSEESVSKCRIVVPALLSVFARWDDLFPHFRICGCGASQIRFEFAGHEGYLWAEWDEGKAWRNGGFAFEPYIGVDLVYEPRSSTGRWCGSVRADLPNGGRYRAEELDRLADDIVAIAQSFRKSVASVVEAPIVCDEVDSVSSYRETRGERRVYHPASTAEETADSLKAYGVHWPVALAQAIVGESDLTQYEQRDYNAQHDIERILKNVCYEVASGQLDFAIKTVECANIARIPTSTDLEEMRISGLSIERVRAVALLGEDALEEPDPYRTEWTVTSRELEGGLVQYWAQEFPEIVEAGVDYGAVYHRLYERINTRIDELIAQGEPVPNPISAVERENQTRKGV